MGSVEARLRWFAHVQRKLSRYIGQKKLRIELPGRRKRPQKIDGSSE